MRELGRAGPAVRETNGCSMSADVGVIGLGVMGANLSRNFASRGFSVAVYNRHTAKTEEFMAKHGSEGTLTASHFIEDFVRSLSVPRRVVMMVPAGAATDAVIDEILPLLSPEDVLVDGGNSYYGGTRRREEAIRPTGIRFFGVGISGGEEGALKGPSIMPGGDEAGYKVVGPYLEAIAAKIDGETCCAWMGPDGAGHFVKMVHNGIEYADMQFIAETYDILRNIGGLSPQEIGDVFTRWNNGRLKSYLTEVATEVLAQVDAKTGKAFLDIVKDRAGQKGTGRWTVETALEVGSPVTTIATAVAARALSGQDDIRAAAQQAITGPSVPKVDRQQLIDDLETALWASKVVAYAEGMSLIAKASAEYNWNIDPVRAISVWRAGCIIRANLLTDIRDAFEAAIDVPSLLVAPGIAPRINEAQPAWRRIIALTVSAGIPAPGLSSALTYIDTIRQPKGSTSMIQGMRDFFGAHTYERVDMPGHFHTLWSEDRSEVNA